MMTIKNTSFVNNNNEMDRDNNSIGNISELDDITTPSIKRGFYGLEEMMVRRQHVSIKKFVDKSIQVGNGWIESHDFACQTSFNEEKDNGDVNLDEYLKRYTDESYHNEDVSEDITEEFNNNSKTSENKCKSNQTQNEIDLNKKETGNESLSNSDMSIDFEQDSYQNKNFIDNLANEKENQNHVHISESCDKVNSNTTELVVDDNQIIPTVEDLTVDNNNNVKFLSITKEKNADDLELEQEPPIFQMPKSESTQTDTAFSQIKEKKKVQIISPEITDSEELDVIAEQKEDSKPKIFYTPVKQRVKSTLTATPVMNLERSIGTPGTMNSNYSFRVTHDILTKHISDVEPDQTNWREMRKIDLNAKNIESLNHLIELMPKLKELDLYLFYNFYNVNK
jgi:hypothetical protein